MEDWGARPRATRSHRRTAEPRITTTHIIMTTVSAASRYPWKCFEGSGPTAIGQKLSRTLRNPAVSVVVTRKHNGSSVTHA